MAIAGQPAFIQLRPSAQTQGTPPINIRKRPTKKKKLARFHKRLRKKKTSIFAPTYQAFISVGASLHKV